MKRDYLMHRFVDFIPERLEEGVLYISIEYTTVAHLCCCGCGQEVSITLSPTDWRLIFDGKTVSLEPSIGSWSLPCQSHYFITSNRIEWARQWSRVEIDAGRRYDAARKQPQLADDSPATPLHAAPHSPEKDNAVRTQPQHADDSQAEMPVQTVDPPEKDSAAKRSIWGWLRSWWT